MNENLEAIRNELDELREFILEDYVVNRISELELRGELGNAYRAFRAGVSARTDLVDRRVHRIEVPSDDETIISREEYNTLVQRASAFDAACAEDIISGFDYRRLMKEFG